MLINRRALLAGAGATVSSAALGAAMVPAASPEPEDIGARVTRLAEELSLTLAEWNRGCFRAIVQPEGKSRCPVVFVNMMSPTALDLQHWLDTAEPRNVVDYHLAQLTSAMHRVHGGGWKGLINSRHKFAMVAHDPAMQPVAMIDFTHR
jgi:hypothetical protein